MNNKELREVVGQLEALEALAKLFNNLWFDQIRRDIKDEKVQAYLMVFEDAFPHVNHVIEFVRRSAGLLTNGPTDQEHWAQLQSEFETLRSLLAGAEHVAGTDSSAAPSASPAPAVSAMNDDISAEEREALEAVDQSDIDALFDDEDDHIAGEAEAVSDDIDALFQNGSDDDAEEIDDLEELIAGEEVPSLAGEMIDESEYLEEDEAIAAAEALEAEESAETEDEDQDVEEVEAPAVVDEASDADDSESDEEGDEEADLEDLLQDDAGEEDADEEEIELEDLLEGDGAEEEDDDDEDDLGAGISDDEMTALLDDGSADGEDEQPEDAAGDDAGEDAGENEDDSDDDESISEDEIDALFG